MDTPVKVINNITETVKDDLVMTLKKGSKVSVAAACFSMYAYKELKKQMEGVDEFRFIFTAPTFTTEKATKEKREFYIPRLNRESSLYGTEFEIKLRNEMTQKAIARECAEWIKSKAVFKSNTSGENMPGFMTVDNQQSKVAYMPMNGFTTVDIGCDRGNNAYNMTNRMESPFSMQYMQLFDTIWNDKEKMQDVTDVVVENITSAYNENSPEFIYFMTLFHVFSEFLDDISEDVLPNEATGFKQSKIWNLLYDFQKDAVLAIINKLEKYNGCILADSVGLGKTFTALAVVKYYENRNKTVLVLCPKKLAENWNTYKDNYVNNPIATDRLNYDVLFNLQKYDMASDILKGLYQKNRKENILLYSIFAEMKCINYAWREGHYENRDRLIELIKQLDTLNDNKQYKSNGNLVAMLYLETEYNLGVYEKLHWPGRKLQLPEPGDGEYAGAASGGGEGRSCLRRVQRKLSRYW